MQMIFKFVLTFYKLELIKLINYLKVILIKISFFKILTIEMILAFNV